jgi:hypothetical protein
MRPSWISKKLRLVCGVPQGFMLGLLLFLMYTVDLIKVHLATWSNAAPLYGRHANLWRLSNIRRRIVFCFCIWFALCQTKLNEYSILFYTKSSSMRCVSRYLDKLQPVTAERR